MQRTIRSAGYLAVAAAAGVAVATGPSASAVAATRHHGLVIDPDKAPSITASSAAIYDEAAHKWRYTKKGTARHPIGSVTKVMTAYTVLRHSHLGTRITVTKADVSYPRRYDGSTAGLHAGEKLTTRQLLYALLLPSGCDAAHTLARHYGGGSVKKFVATMNRYARSMRMTHTHYANMDGLPYKDSSGRSGYSAADDQVRLAHHIIRSATFRGIVAHKSYRLAAGSGHRSHTWNNTNQLLGSFHGATGIKTGTTSAAGHCLMFSARRSGRTVIGVVLHSTSSAKRYDDADKLLNYAYGHKAVVDIVLRKLPRGTNHD